MNTPPAAAIEAAASAIEEAESHQPVVVPTTLDLAQVALEAALPLLLPTREQIAEELFNHFIRYALGEWGQVSDHVKERYLDAADAVLALLQEGNTNE